MMREADCPELNCPELDGVKTSTRFKGSAELLESSLSDTYSLPEASKAKPVGMASWLVRETLLVSSTAALKKSV